MAICATVDSATGFIKQSSTAIDSCTSYVILDSTEYHVSYPVMSHDDAALLAFSVVAVWAIAWGFRVLRRAF